MSYTAVTGQLNGTLTITTQKKIETNKNVTPTTSQQVVEPSEGYDGLAKVTVAAAPLENGKTVTPTTSQQVVEPDGGFIGLKKVTVLGATDQLTELMKANGDQVTLNIDMGNRSCHGFVNGNAGYNLTITGTNVIDMSAFTYQKYLKAVTADEVVGLANGNEFSYSGLTTGHFASLQFFVNSTFKGCTDIRHLYFGYAGVAGGGPLSSGRIFDGKSSGTVDIHVPADQLSAYQANSTWTGIISAEAAAGVTVNLVGDYA